jgi:glucose-6-phosphate isomerase
MDQHFHQTPFENNIPVILALLGIWYGNFFDAAAHVIVPYSHRLRSFVAYIQQLDMESNGKSVAINGDRIHYATGPVIFGEEGCNSQHSFYQLLHQGRHVIPMDLIIIAKPHHATHQAQHDIVLASALSQAYAFMRGKTIQEARHELNAQGLAAADADARHLAEHLVIEGNKPANLLMLDELSPKNLGALLAIYEHKIFVQSIIWNINPFDQWGVELGKKNLPMILQQMSDNTVSHALDADTANLIRHLKNSRSKL